MGKRSGHVKTRNSNTKPSSISSCSEWPTAIVFRHAIAVPKSQMSVFPSNPRLAKLSIKPIELIDDVGGQNGLESGGNGSGHHFSVEDVGFYRQNVRTQARPIETPISQNMSVCPTFCPTLVV